MNTKPGHGRIHTSNSGFTLIELLVVIAIIAILAAILFPVFARARENARRASCQSNLKQISLGMIQYNQDFDERYPPESGLGGSGPAVNALGWASLLQPYLKSKQIFQCPSEPTLANDDPASYNAGPYAGLGSFTDYSMNYLLHTRSLSVLTSSANTLTAIDYITWHARNNTVAPEVPDSKRHLEGANYAYADGHVKWLQPEKVTSSDVTAANCTTKLDGSAGTGAGAPGGGNTTFCMN